MDLDRHVERLSVFAGRHRRFGRELVAVREERAEIERHDRSMQSASLSTFGDLLAKAQRDKRH